MPRPAAPPRAPTRLYVGDHVRDTQHPGWGSGIIVVISQEREHAVVRVMWLDGSVSGWASELFGTGKRFEVSR
jgi:hypothetical protein